MIDDNQTVSRVFDSTFKVTQPIFDEICGEELEKNVTFNVCYVQFNQDECFALVPRRWPTNNGPEFIQIPITFLRTHCEIVEPPVLH